MSNEKKCSICGFPANSNAKDLKNCEKCNAAYDEEVIDTYKCIFLHEKNIAVLTNKRILILGEKIGKTASKKLLTIAGGALLFGLSGIVISSAFFLSTGSSKPGAPLLLAAELPLKKIYEARVNNKTSIGTSMIIELMTRDEYVLHDVQSVNNEKHGEEVLVDNINKLLN